MAIAQTAITRAVGFGRSDVITQLEQGFTWLGWHGSTRTGIVTGISAYSGGGTVGSSNDTYEDVRQSTSTGIGTGASFYTYLQLDMDLQMLFMILISRELILGVY